jgi:undecaprenyl pyrophosphate phosphatase UppP
VQEVLVAPLQFLQLLSHFIHWNIFTAVRVWGPLAVAEKTANYKKNIEDVTFLDSMLIGLAQAVDLIPA